MSLPSSLVLLDFPAQLAFGKAAVVGATIYTILFVALTRMFVDSRDARKVRTMEDLLSVAYYGTLCAVSLVFYSDQLRWLGDGYTYTLGKSRPDYFAATFCGFQTGAYFAMAFCVWLAPRKRDAPLMTAHHIVTAFVVLFCSLGGYAHACVTILLLHDLCDVPLTLMVLARRARNKLVMTLGYCLTVPAFAVFRLLLFPLVTYVAANSNPLPASWVIIPLNSVLWCMHVYWLSILLRMGYRHLLGLSVSDPRELPEPPKTKKEKNEAIGEETTKQPPPIEETRAQEIEQEKEEEEEEEEERKKVFLRRSQRLAKKKIN